MQNIVVLSVFALLTAPAFAAPTVLINCASGSYRGVLQTIVPNAEVAGVVMTSVAAAHERADLVVHNSVNGMVAPDDATGIVIVIKRLEELSHLDTTCVVFAGVDPRSQPIGPADKPAPPTTWSSRLNEPKKR